MRSKQMIQTKWPCNKSILDSFFPFAYRGVGLELLFSIDLFWGNKKGERHTMPQCSPMGSCRAHMDPYTSHMGPYGPTDQIVGFALGHAWPWNPVGAYLTLQGSALEPCRRLFDPTGFRPGNPVGTYLTLQGSTLEPCRRLFNPTGFRPGIL